MLYEVITEPVHHADGAVAHQRAQLAPGRADRPEEEDADQHRQEEERRRHPDHGPAQLVVERQEQDRQQAEQVEHRDDAWVLGKVDPLNASEPVVLVDQFSWKNEGLGTGARSVAMSTRAS